MAKRARSSLSSSRISTTSRPVSSRLLSCYSSFLTRLFSVLIFTRLLASPPRYTSDDPTSIQSPTIDSYTEKATATTSATGSTQPDVSIDVVRFVELTDRTSAVMQASETEENLRRDPLGVLFSTFASLNGLPITSSFLAVIPYVSFPETVVGRAHVVSSDFILVPWNLGKAVAEESAVASLSKALLSFRKPALSSLTSFSSPESLRGPFRPHRRQAQQPDRKSVV